MYKSTISLSSALDAGGGQPQAPAALPAGWTGHPLYRRLGGLHDRSGPLHLQPIATIHLCTTCYNIKQLCILNT